MPTNIFIAYDFEIGGTLPGNLEGVSDNPPEGCLVDWPGSPEGLKQGAIWKSRVEPGIRNCDRLLAFVDLPNANVGFEVGYGLGLGKAVGLACVRPLLSKWLSDPPLNGFLCPRLSKPKEIRDAVQSPDHWIRLAGAPTPGTGVLVLCPTDTGAAYLEKLPPGWGWQTLPENGWDLHDVPEHLNEVGLVVWVIAPHDEGAAGRDGRENAALSVIAGYAEARPEIELRVLQAKNARAVLDVIAARTEFSTLREFRERLEVIRAEWEAKQTPPPVIVSDEAICLQRPAIAPLPPDDWSVVPDRFIGRQLQLNDVADAVQGLLHRARTGQQPEGGRTVKVIWVHGFGGMGKSWFLHRSRLQAGADVRAAIVDWDSTVWRYPLTGEPRCADHLFETIAYRLVQTCGETAADPYWFARERVRLQGEHHRRLRDQFEGQLSPAAGPERVGSGLLQLLKQEGIWVDDEKKRTRNVENWRRDAKRFQAIFETWCRETARDAENAAINPDGVLAEGLRESLRQAAREKPLLLLLDTCEVLSADLDRWLQNLLAPLCRDETPLLVLIGSRLRPDVALAPGSREGWQAELRERFRDVPFAESRRFSVEEIEAALDKLKRPVEGDHGKTAEQLHRITLGVPLALRALLDLHDDGIEGSILRELAEREEEPLDEGEAVRQVVGTVAQRLLYHLSLERKPEREDDLRDIIALAVLQRADGDVLAQLWPELRPRDRLKDLGARYALLSGGDLHATVRDYLRRYWRDEANRPALFDDVFDAVEQAIQALPPVSEEEGNPEAIARRTMQLNLSAWRDGDRAVPELARLLVVVMAHDEGIEDVEALLRDLPLAASKLTEARKLWKTAGEAPERKRTIAWLRGLCNSSQGWTDHEYACLALVEGITAAEWGMKANDALPAFSMLKAAFDHFGAERLPQRSQAGEGFYSVGYAFSPSESNEARWSSQTEVAYLCAIQLGTREAICFNNLGVLYHDHLQRYPEAEQAYLTAIQLDSKFAYPHNGLGNLYQFYLQRYPEAEQAYLTAIQLDSKFSPPHNGLGDLYTDHLQRYSEAEQAYITAIPLDPKAGSSQRGLAWLCLLHKEDLPLAQQYAQEAMTREPTHPGTPFAIMAVTTWTNGWINAQSLMPDWLAKSPIWFSSFNHGRLVALFRRIREQGGLSTLAEMLRAVEDRACWKPWSEALSALDSGNGPPGGLSAEASRIFDELSRIDSAECRPHS